MTDPAPEEWAQAKALLAASEREICAMRLGGQRPSDSRAASWWGGNFIAPPPEGAVAMWPLIQIRVADLPVAFQTRFRADYLLFWLAPDFDMLDPVEGRDFIIRELPAPERTAPADRASPDDGRALKLFQMFPETGTSQRPSWEDFALELPDAVARADDSDWFFDHPNGGGDDDRPVLIGGWPQWIQGSQTPDGGSFLLQISSSFKGKLGLGDSGNLYLFRMTAGWVLRTDCY